jgi:hypothetical protein
LEKGSKSKGSQSSVSATENRRYYYSVSGKRLAEEEKILEIEKCCCLHSSTFQITEATS